MCFELNEKKAVSQDSETKNSALKPQDAVGLTLNLFRDRKNAEIIAKNFLHDEAQAFLHIGDSMIKAESEALKLLEQVKQGGLSDFSSGHVSKLTFLVALVIMEDDVKRNANDVFAKAFKKLNKMYESASKGGKAHHAEDRQAFKNDYRHERKENPEKPRSRIIDDLTTHYSSRPRTTLNTWAKDADMKDEFIRKGGRPKKGE